jgi:hypothetical protein
VRDYDVKWVDVRATAIVLVCRGSIGV